MNHEYRLQRNRLEDILESMRSIHVLVVGDIILDHYLWGNVDRISPEAPVPVLAFTKENYMPGGAANVARNITALDATCGIHSVAGYDPAYVKIRKLLEAAKVDTSGIHPIRSRLTSIKTRIIAHQQQIVRIDKESSQEVESALTLDLLESIYSNLMRADAIIIEDYGKGVVSQSLVQEITRTCLLHGKNVSMDPKPVHQLDTPNLSLVTPNRKEAFELAGLRDHGRDMNPLQDMALLKVADILLQRMHPSYLLITLGRWGMLLCEADKEPLHIPTVAQEVYDVSGAGDTVIATFTLALCTGALPIEAAIIANYAAGIVVGKIGAATVTPDDLLKSFKKRQSIQVETGCEQLMHHV